MATVVMALVCSQSDAGSWPLLLFPVLIAFGLERRRAVTGRREDPLLAAWWVVAALLLVVLPAWVTTDLPFLLRSLAVGAADVVVVSVASALFLRPGWFDPSRRVHPFLEGLRRLSGPATAAVTAAILVPASWPVGTMAAVWACALVPLIVGARLSGVDHLVRSAVPLIREEGQRGRDQVLREIHGALSTELRQLEQYARDQRLVVPEIYERAVSANSSLRETLTLADEDRDTSTSPDTLVAAVLTLTRAEGASVNMRVEVDRLEAGDRDLVRLVLNDLVGSSLRAGASALDIVVAEGPAPEAGPVSGSRRLWVSMTGSRLPDAGAATLWLPQLERKLASFDGSLTSHAASAGFITVNATWVTPA